MTDCYLYAPSGYASLDKYDHYEICNGCGPDGFLSFLIPDTIYFLDISEACNIHDYMYHVGVTEKDRIRADRVLKNNLLRIIDYNTKWKWLKKLRYKRAEFMHKMVSLYGGHYFWKNKNKTINKFLID
jgi:hypothetical protein